MTYTPGNASDSGSGYLMLPLNPHAKPFIQAFDIKHMKDFRTFKFMTFCMILSLAFNLNWVKKVTSLTGLLNKLEFSLPLDTTLFEDWNESNVIDNSGIPSIVDISTPNITKQDELDPMGDHLTLSSTNLNPLAVHQNLNL